MGWAAVKLAGYLAAVAACAWSGAFAVGPALFPPSPAPVPPPVTAPAAGRPAHLGPPSPAPLRSWRPRLVPRASVAPVSAAPVRTRRHPRTAEPSPAWTTPSATQSPDPTPTPAPAPTEAPTATTAPPAPTLAGTTPPLPGAGTGSIP